MPLFFLLSVRMVCMCANYVYIWEHCFLKVIILPFEKVEGAVIETNCLVFYEETIKMEMGIDWEWLNYFILWPVALR